MTDKPIHYEPHPVTPERKAELVKKGVRILDAKFAPPGWSAPAAPATTEVAPTHGDAPPEAQKPAQLPADESEPAERAGEDVETDDLKALLDARGIRYRSNASRAALFALLRGE